MTKNQHGELSDTAGARACASTWFTPAFIGSHGLHRCYQNASDTGSPISSPSHRVESFDPLVASQASN